MRSRGGPPPTSEGVAASSPRHLLLQTQMFPSSVPSSLRRHVDRDTQISQADSTSVLPAVFQVVRSPTGAFYFPTHNSSLRPEAPKFEPPSSLSAGAWCFTPPIIDLTSVLSPILEGDEWAEDADWQWGEKIARPAAPHLGGSSLGTTTRAGSCTGAPASGRGPIVTFKCPGTTANPDINSLRKAAPRRTGSRGPRRGLPRKAPNTKESTAAPRRRKPVTDVKRIRSKDKRRRAPRRTRPMSARTRGDGHTAGLRDLVVLRRPLSNLTVGTMCQTKRARNVSQHKVSSIIVLEKLE
mmetsp:Transcript_14597/g.33877  ORF Transcript_14597/g.33877 Transcript_14597/m.33877 type:complete len:296 (+) Transcript_14597:645-1532(+)